MPLENKEDIASETEKGPLCRFCIDSEGNPKSCKEVFEGGVQFFMKSANIDRNLAERVTRKNMNQQPLWKGKEKECLKGEQATDEEFKNTLDKLHSEIKKGNVKE
jgi:hypothetical protein